MNYTKEKLKTLKDLKSRDVMVYNSPDESDYDIVEVDELKQEAVKWYHRSCGDKHKFIVDFFNLTEEEIKQGSSHKTDDN